MSNAAYIDWPALLLLLLVLGWTAHQFSRRTYRITVLAAAVAGVAALTEYGTFISRAANFVNAFNAGGKNVIDTMFGWMVPGPQAFAPGIIGWAVLLVLCAGMLIWFDTWSARREQPWVSVAEAPQAEAGIPELTQRRTLTEELRFRLPAVYVRKPASMPGGSTLDNLASMVSESDVRGGKAAAALMRVVHALEGQPRTYEARIFVERCPLPGQLGKDGHRLRITVDLQNARTGQSVAVRMLPACLPEEAAERAAGFAARQVFHDDPSTPDWVAVSPDGDDLSACLLAREICAAGPTFGDLWQSRQQRRAKLGEAVRNGPAPGLAGYELAAMDDLDGDYLDALLLHLRNRIQYPHFWAGRHRLAISLSWLAWLVRDEKWRCRVKTVDGAAQQHLAHTWAEIAQRLDRAGLLRGLGDIEAESLGRDMWKRDPDTVSRALLHLAEQEHQACWRSAGTARILWTAFCHREMRTSLLQQLRGNQWWHPRRRRLASVIGIDLIEQRLNLLEDGEHGKHSLCEAQQRAKKRLRMDTDPAGLTRKVPWQAAYNAACLYALSDPGHKPPDPKKILEAIKLLRWAVDNPACDLEHPCEWIAMDPDLRQAREDKDFEKFVTELAARDFVPSALPQGGDKWFRACLTAATNLPQ